MRGELAMTGPEQEAQAALFLEFSPESHVPQDHLLRSINLSDIPQYWAAFYSIEATHQLIPSF